MARIRRSGSQILIGHVEAEGEPEVGVEASVCEPRRRSPVPTPDSSGCVAARRVRSRVRSRPRQRAQIVLIFESPVAAVAHQSLPHALTSLGVAMYSAVNQAAHGRLSSASWLLSHAFAESSSGTWLSSLRRVERPGLPGGGFAERQRPQRSQRRAAGRSSQNPSTEATGRLIPSYPPRGAPTPRGTMIFGSRGRRERREQLAAGFLPRWRELLSHRLRHWDLLSDDERARLEYLALDLMVHKRWEASKGFAAHRRDQGDDRCRRPR